VETAFSDAIGKQQKGEMLITANAANEKVLVGELSSA
jgi:hypothetical protein